jgi:hypothetical protein
VTKVDQRHPGPDALGKRRAKHRVTLSLAAVLILDGDTELDQVSTTTSPDAGAVGLLQLRPPAPSLLTSTSGNVVA